MTYSEQLRRDQIAGLDRALEQYAALCDRLATAPGPEEDEAGEEGDSA